MCDPPAINRNPLCRSCPRCPSSYSKFYPQTPNTSHGVVLLLSKYVKYFCIALAPVVLLMFSLIIEYIVEYVLHGRNKDLLTGHIFFCTIGLNYLQGMAILINVISQGSREPAQRAYAHGFLHFLGLVLNIVGIIYIANYGKYVKGGNLDIRTTHSILGIVASVLSGASLISGAYAVAFDWPITGVHIFFGLPCFIVSTICLVFGIQSIKDQHNHYVLGVYYPELTVILVYVYVAVNVILIILKFILGIVTWSF